MYMSELLAEAAEEPRENHDERHTVRISGPLLTQAAEICARHGITFAGFVRAASRRLVSEYASEPVQPVAE